MDSNSQQKKSAKPSPSLYEEIASVLAKKSASIPTRSDKKKAMDSSDSSLQDKETQYDPLEEIRQLKHQLDVSRSVYITDPGGLLRHAYGSFQDGMFNPDSAGVLWDVGLGMCGMGDSMEVKELSDIEIRIGGVVFATSSDIALNAIKVGTAPGNKFDGDDRSRSVTCLFSSGRRNDTWEPRTNGWPLRSAWLTFQLKKINDLSWNNLQAIADDDDMDVYEAIVQEIPWKTAKLTSISFCAESVWGIIDNLKRGPRFEREKEDQYTRMYGLMSEAAYNKDEPGSSSAESSNREMPSEEEQSNDEEWGNGSECSDEMDDENEDDSNEESSNGSKCSNEIDDEEKTSSNSNDEVEEKEALVGKTEDHKKEASSEVEDAKVATNCNSGSTDKKEERKIETEATEEPLCKKRKPNDDDASHSSNNNKESVVGSSSPSNTMPVDEAVMSALDFLQMKSLCPERVVRPCRTVKFVGAWMQL